MKTKDKTLKTGVYITYDKNGNIKELTTPYDDDFIIQNPDYSSFQGILKSLKNAYNNPLTNK